MKIKISELEAIVEKSLRTQYSSDQTELIKDIMMFGELTGKPSHGILRLLKRNLGVFSDEITAKPEIIKKTNVSSLVVGNGNPGMLVGPMAMHEVIRITNEHGIGVVGATGSYGTSGSLSYYCENIAKAGFIGVVLAKGTSMVAPFNSSEGLLGTNPIAFGIPTSNDPFLFDMATSAITFGTVAKLKSEGKQLPPNVAIDKDGEMTTDPGKAMEGALLAFGSYKGSGLSLIIEMLGGIWTGASYADKNLEKGYGNLFMAFSPDLLLDKEAFLKDTSNLLERITNSKTKDGAKVRIPGENTLKIRDENIKNGEIEVNESILEEINKSLAANN